ncbi:hypothetical protein K7432_013529 [Basidiobolus ranarum]|uniref:Seed maturation protein n=1 Tax=Basidiobolus ranarum TaxID=34480 RepID=A0ABR2VQP6_9FUNG
MSKITATAKNAAGTIQESLGRIFNNEGMIAKGEQKQYEAHEKKLAVEERNAKEYYSSKGVPVESGHGTTHKDEGVQCFYGNALNIDQSFGSPGRDNIEASLSDTHDSKTKVSNDHKVTTSGHSPMFAAASGMHVVENPVGREGSYDLGESCTNMETNAPPQVRPLL